MTRDEIISAVKSKIDELTPFDGGLALITSSGNTNLNPVEVYIEQFLDESAKETLLEAPAITLPTTAFPNVTYSLSESKAMLKVEDDYLRVGMIKFSSWERPVFNATYPGDPIYNRQFNKWTRGGKAKPRAVYVNEGGVGYLVCYGVESETGNEASYVATAVAEDMPNALLEAMQWHNASLVLQVFGKEKISQMAYGRYTKALSLL